MYKFLYIFVVIFIVSCTSNTIFKKPDDLIPEDQMVDLLTDMYLATAAKKVTTKNKKRNVDFFYFVYEKHGIDSTRFQKSNFYYTTKIDEYEKIHQKVSERIEKLKLKYNLLKKEKDSLKRDSILQKKKQLDSIRRIGIEKDSLFLKLLNSRMKDTTKLYDLKKVLTIRESISLKALYQKNRKEDSLFLDSINQTQIDSTKHFNLRDTTLLKNFILTDSIRKSYQVKKDSIILDTLQ